MCATETRQVKEKCFCVHALVSSILVKLTLYSSIFNTSGPSSSAVYNSQMYFSSLQFNLCLLCSPQNLLKTTSNHFLGQMAKLVFNPSYYCLLSSSRIFSLGVCNLIFSQLTSSLCNCSCRRALKMLIQILHGPTASRNFAVLFSLCFLPINKPYW